MAVTNGWGQAAKNNTNGFGKLATNNIGAGSVYEDSYSGDTALIGVSAAFSYSAASFTQADSDPTPTITGTTGGTFSGTSGLVFVSTSTGEINLSASTIAAHVVTYTVDGVSSTFNLSVVSPPYTSTSSFSFDGVNDVFLTGLSLAYTAVPNVTLSCWIKVNYTGVSAHTSSYPVGINSSHPNGSPIRLHYNGSTSLILIQGQGGNTFSTTNLNDGNWHHIAQTIQYDTGGTIFNVYIDGVKEITDKLLYSHTPLTGDFVIGALTTNFGFFKGNIDEVSVWDSILSSDAITEIATGPNDLESLTNASSSNLKAWYKMGE